MILIADSGSTKCDWLLVDSKGNLVSKQVTSGINPVMFSLKEIKNRISLASDILVHAQKITHVYFYSAGCGLSSSQNLLRHALLGFYVNAEIEVYSDLVAAVRATAKEPSIVCILGTGSNSCYYDGENIHLGFDSLGYSIMDEASGNYYGKQLLKDYFYKKMPTHIAERFASQYELTADEILQHLYKKPMPAQYLASFAKFIFDIGLTDSYLMKLIENGFEELVEYQFKLWPNHKEIPIHFIGSIAYFAKDILRAKLESKDLIVGNVLKAPINGLVTYHQDKLKNNL